MRKVNLVSAKSALRKVPFLGGAIESAEMARAAANKGRTMDAIRHGTSAVADIGFPVFIGQAVHEAAKDNKMKREEMNKLSSLTDFYITKTAKKKTPPGFIRSLGATAKAGIKGLWKHKVPIGVGTLIGGTGLLAGLGLSGGIYGAKKALEERHTYGPTQSFSGGQNL